MPQRDEDTRQPSERLYDIGLRHLAADEWDDALAIAAELEEQRYSGAFELAGLAHTAKGDRDAAISTLQRGVKVAPDVWLNWQLLGNYLSDRGDYAAAKTAYDTALDCPGARLCSIHLNQAILAARVDQPDEALHFVELVKDPELSARAAGIRINVLVDLGRPVEALEVAEKLLSELDTDTADDELIGDVHAQLAELRLRSGVAEDDVRELLMTGLCYDQNNASILSSIRELANQTSPAAQYFRILLHGPLRQEEDLDTNAIGFFAPFDVVADTLQEALAIIRGFEESPSLFHAGVDEYEILESRPDGLKGIYSRGTWHLYDTIEDECDQSSA